MRKIFAIVLTVCLLLPTSAEVGAAQLPAYRLQTRVHEGKATVRVDICNNPGVISLRFQIVYSDTLELLEVRDEKLLAGMTEPSPQVESPYILRWADFSATENNGENGTVATLTFGVKGAGTVSVLHVEGRNALGEKVVFADSNVQILGAAGEETKPAPQPTQPATEATLPTQPATEVTQPATQATQPPETQSAPPSEPPAPTVEETENGWLLPVVGLCCFAAGAALVALLGRKRLFRK